MARKPRPFYPKSFKLGVMAFISALALISLFSTGARLSRSPLVDMAVDEYLLHNTRPVGPQRLVLAAAIADHAKLAAPRELVFVFVSLLASWTASAAVFVVVNGEDDRAGRARRVDLREFLLTLSSAAALVMGYGLVVEVAVLVLLRISFASVVFVAAAAVLAFAFRVASFCVGTVLGQALAMSALDGDGRGAVEALRRPLRLFGGSPPSDLDLPL